jgi:hypothetical protein
MNIKSTTFGKLLNLLFFCLPVFLLGNPIISSEVPEEVLEEGASFPQILSLIALLIVTQIVVVACVWSICWLARKVKENEKMKTDSWQNNPPEADKKD